MFQAQQLTAKAATSTPSVYSPWVNRMGDNMLYSVDLVDKSGSALQLKVTVLTKNTEDLPSAQTTLTNITTTGSGSEVVTEEQAGGIKEQVRYKFELAGTIAAGDWVLFRMLQPIWYDSVTA
ncbi:MAG: hypothetical protein R3C29_17905 [Dehalococcoidia bacterium]